MKSIPEDIEGLDRLVHEPARFVILNALASCASADFMFLGRMTGLTKGNLSTHLTKLEAAGLVTVDKRFIERRPNTNVTITADGRRAVARHWSTLERIRQEARELRRRPGLGPRASRVDLRRAEADG